jgi:tRNA G18 (ribose-2'-O)-methylase SpoU
VPVIEIDDPADERLSDYTGLTDVALRSKSEPGKGLYIAESSTVLRRALEAGHRPRFVLLAHRWLPDVEEMLVAVPGGDQVPVYVAAPRLLEHVTGFHVHRGALAAMHRPVLPTVADVLASAERVEGAREGTVLKGDVDHSTGSVGPEVHGRRGPSRVVVLEDIVDHTNVGAAMRACAAMGVDAVLVTPSCADPLYRRAIRVSMGTVFQVPWTRFRSWPHAPVGEPSDGIDLLREWGYTVAALALDDDSVSLDAFTANLPERLALVFGTEGDGLKRRTVAGCDLTVRIPMAGGVDSLNVASAIAVTAWATRSR